MHTVCSASETHEARDTIEREEEEGTKTKRDGGIEKDTRETGHSREDFEPRGERELYKS